jgi:hypothetical protein
MRLDDAFGKNRTAQTVPDDLAGTTGWLASTHELPPEAGRERAAIAAKKRLLAKIK